MVQKKRGCCSLKLGAVITGALASAYNGALLYWFYNTLESIPLNDELVLVLQVLLGILMCLAVVHIVISLLLIYGVLKEIPDLVMLWVVVYISSCLVVAGLFTIGLAFMWKKVFLYIILCNFLFVFNIGITLKLYKKMISQKAESV